MRKDHYLLAALAIAGLGAAAPIGAPPVEPGAYAVTYRLEMPHLERYAIERTSMVCVEPDMAHLPVLGVKATFAGCERSSVARNGVTLGYRLTCPGRAGARAQAIHRATPDGYKGRIAIILGAKNMSMVEVQSARRIGDCGE